MSSAVTKIPASTETVPIEKRKLIDAWRLMERLVVSLRKIGGVYSTPAEDVPQTPEQRQGMLEAVDQLMGPDTFREMAHVREVLSELIDEDEAIAISDSLQFWSPPAPSNANGQEH